MKSPNDIVAERVAAALEAADALLPESTIGLTRKLAEGKMAPSDWVTLIGLDEKARKNNGNNQTKKY